MPETTTPKIEGKNKLEMTLESMEKIEDSVEQWMILEEHWTKYELNRREQLSRATGLFTEIKREILAAYATCPSYSGGE